MSNFPHADFDPIIVGRVGAPHGVRGWVRIRSYTSPVDNIRGYAPWWFATFRGTEREAEAKAREMMWRKMNVTACREHKDAFIAQLAEVPDRTAAETLVGTWIAVDRSQLPKLALDEYYWRELIGLSVVNTDDVSLGRIERMLETGAHDVMQVRDADREAPARLIPFVGDYVLSVDMSAGVVCVEWPADWR